MLNILVFSKDRACQLDLFIRSFKKYFKGCAGDSLSVIYTYSTIEYKEGYELLIERHSGINFIDEKGRSFKTLTEQNIHGKNPYTVFFVDDNIFKGPFSIECKEMALLGSDSDILCLSLRLYSGIDYCYTIPCKSPAPTLSPENTWAWRGLLGDWGYPMSLDGHIFRTHEILYLMTRTDYKSPNTLEGALATRPLSKEKMVCLDESVIINNPCNKVQTDNGNHCGTVRADFLNKLYLIKKQISLCNIEGLKNKSPHQEIDVVVETWSL